MKPHNDDVSAPAGVPHLQDAGYTITYEDVRVTAQFLQELKAEIKAADDRAKYGLFRTRLFYGNLRRWQRQGLHCIYTNDSGTEHCTCGLVLHEHGNYYQEIAVKVTERVEDKLDGIKLEQIHLAWGHKELPSLKGSSVALIVGFIYKEEIGEYLWTSICQRCGDYQIEVTNDDAKSFVKAHNKLCATSVTKKKGE